MTDVAVPKARHRIDVFIAVGIPDEGTSTFHDLDEIGPRRFGEWVKKTADHLFDGSGGLGRAWARCCIILRMILTSALPHGGVGSVYDTLIGFIADSDQIRNALAAGILVSAICAIVGTFVVMRGMAFVGDALSHGVLPGVAAATLWGFSPVLGAFLGATTMMGGVAVVSKRTRLSNDTAVGLSYVLMLAIGVMMMSHTEDYLHELTHSLFGDPLEIDGPHLVWLGVAIVLVGAVAFAARRPFLLWCIDEDLVRTSGFSPTWTNLLMNALIGLTVVASFNAVGTLLVFGMLIAPSATGALLAHRLRSMMLIAFGVGTFSTYLGLVISYHAEIEPSATIVAVAVGVFIIAMTFGELSNLRRPREVEVGHHVHDHHHSYDHGVGR